MAGPIPRLHHQEQPKMRTRPKRVTQTHLHLCLSFLKNEQQQREANEALQRGQSERVAF